MDPTVFNALFLGTPGPDNFIFTAPQGTVNLRGGTNVATFEQAVQSIFTGGDADFLTTLAAVTDLSTRGGDDIVTISGSVSNISLNNGNDMLFYNALASSDFVHLGSGFNILAPAIGPTPATPLEYVIGLVEFLRDSIEDSIIGGPVSDVTLADVGNYAKNVLNGSEPLDLSFLSALDVPAAFGEIRGGSGSDVVLLGSMGATKVVLGAAGGELPVFGFGANFLASLGTVTNVVGGSDTDIVLINGTQSTNLGGGDDVFVSLGSVGTVIGGDDYDIIVAAAGGQDLRGGLGNDVIIGAGTIETARGNADNDTIVLLDGGTAIGGGGDDFMYINERNFTKASGNTGDDTFQFDVTAAVGSERNVVVGGEGDETAGDTLIINILNDEALDFTTFVDEFNDFDEQTTDLITSLNLRVREVENLIVNIDGTQYIAGVDTLPVSAQNNGGNTAYIETLANGLVTQYNALLAPLLPDLEIT